MTNISTAAIIVDVQGKLAGVMHNHEALMRSLEAFALCMRHLQIPTLWTEQIPDKLGPTVATLQPLMAPAQPITKHHFGCMGETRFVQALEAIQPKRVLLCGIETHVCVFQTAIQLLRSGYAVEVIADAVSSRTEANRLIGIDRMRAAGAAISSVECSVFDLMESATHPAFREVLRVIK